MICYRVYNFCLKVFVLKLRKITMAVLLNPCDTTFLKICKFSILNKYLTTV
jgi:hypothetical protein